MTRTEHARHAATIRWAGLRAKHYDAVHMIRGRALTAASSIDALTRDLETEQAGAARVALAELLRAFRELWEFSGHDLPVGMRDYAAGIIDELRRQAALREGDTG